MSKTAQKASAAERLQGNKAFKDFIDEVREDQKAVFASPSSSIDQISDAHNIIRALEKIVGKLQQAVLDHKIEERKDKSRQ